MDFYDEMDFYNSEIYNEELYHYGTAHVGMTPHSGRYPYGSGKNPNQHVYGASLLDTYTRLRKSGMSNKEIADYMDMSISELTNRTAYAREIKQNELRSIIVGLRNGSDPRCEDGKPMGWTDIGRVLGMPESSVRTKFESVDEEKNFQIINTATALRECIEKNKYVDIGLGTSNLMGVTKTKLDAAVQMLQDEGYDVGVIHVPQPLDPMKNTTINYIAPPGTTTSDVWNNRGEIKPVAGYYTDDSGTTWSPTGIRFPVSIDSSRLMVRYAEEGGIKKDGVIEIRPGVEDLSLGDKNYAQVRIAVDNSRYLKGMAIYSDDLPDGVDIVFNTNKTKEEYPDPVSTLKKFKTIKDDNGNEVVDVANPFGSALKTENGVIIGQSDYIDSKTGEKKQSAINICRAEGDWEEWSRTLASQWLAKQYPATAKRQLNISLDKKKDELDEILKLTNPEIKKKLLQEYADECDLSAVELKAAPLPRQATKVILPLTKIDDDKIYAPTFEDGEEVVLIRYPFGGNFEMPVLHVQNRNQQGKKIIGNSQDAIGINSSVAERLSGADFDGDTVLVIPTKGQKIKTSDPLPQLANFDDKTEYGIKHSDPRYGTVGKSKDYVNENGMHGDGFNTQREMGIVSNLIMDMTLKDAPPEDIAKAVKHSMVVIDAEKHQLDHKQSYKDNGIAKLKEIYQQKSDPTQKPGGASTLITRAKSEERIPHRREVYSTSEMTPDELEKWQSGEKIYRPSNRKYRSGKDMEIKSTKMAETDDARTLISDRNTTMEQIYADYANSCKSLAKKARSEERQLTMTKVNPEAKQKYAKEVSEINKMIDTAMSNKPYERQAQALASAMVASRKKDHPEWTKEDIKKAKVQAMAQARFITGSNKKQANVELTQKHYDAIESGALTSNKIMQILNNTDNEKFRQYATPKNNNEISVAKRNRIKHLLEASGNSAPTIAEIAKEVGVSASTVSKIAAGKT